MSTRAQLKNYFQTGDKPTAAEFADLIDSLAHVGEDGLATQSYVTSSVNSAISNLVGGAPGALDTLDELAAALADDQNFATTITNALAGKQATLVSGSNIRTVNGQSLLGSGDIAIDGLSGINNMSQTWNNGATVFNGIRLNVTDSASSASSNLLDLLVGGTSRFRVSKSGLLTLADELAWSGSAATLLGQPTRLAFRISGAPRMFLDSFSLQTDTAFGWTAPGFPTNPDIYLVRDAGAVLASRNGTNPQAFRLYNTFTDAANHERGFMRWLANVLEIGTEAAGTGSQRDLALLVAQGRAVYFNGTGRSRLSIRNDGNDPIIVADGTSAVHLTVRSGSGNLNLDGGNTGVILRQNADPNNFLVVAASTGDSSIADAAGVSGRRGLALAGFGVTDFYLACPGRPGIDEAKMNLRITGAAARPAATVNLSGGGIFIEAGDGASASSGAANGGNLTLRGGRGYGTGVNGRIIMDRLPTSSAGLPTGALWNDAGTLKIA